MKKFIIILTMAVLLLGAKSVDQLEMNGELTLYKNTTSNLNARARKQGTLYYDTSTNEVKFDNGTALSSIGGGGSTFSDSSFAVFDNGDNTKILNFEVSAVATATTRTITMPNANVSLADVNNAVLINGSRAFTADQSHGGFKITNLATPTASTDASTKGYVDNNFATNTLNNLGTTNINASLLFDSDQSYDIGTNTNAVAIMYVASLIGGDNTNGILIQGGLSGGDINYTTVNTTASSGLQTFSTGNCTAAGCDTGAFSFTSGNAQGTGASDSGSFSFITGTSTNGTRGKITLNSRLVESTSVVQGPDGSASAPTYSFTSDSDNGMFLIGANQLGLTVGGTQKMGITTTQFNIANNFYPSTTDTYNLGNTTTRWAALVATKVISKGSGGDVFRALDNSDNVQHELTNNGQGPASLATGYAWHSVDGTNLLFYTDDESTSTANIYFETGNASSGNSGGLLFRTGTATGTRGNADFNVNSFRVVAGNSGFGNITPTVKVDIDGALAVRDDGVGVNLTADNQVITVGNRSFIRITSDSATATDRTFVLTQGTRNGHILVLQWNDATNLGELVDDAANNGGGNIRLSATWLPTQYDTLTLISTGTDWIEIGRSTN